MISNKALEKIDKRDLEILIQDSVAEGKSIEYKLQLPGNADGDRKEFLNDVSSFANTSGGDLIFGIKDEDGVAIKINGISVSNIDEEIRKYENLIRDGIEPRIQATIHTVPIEDNKIVLIIRINKSWIGPHRVIFKGHDKFYARNSRGKYALDTMELRTAFNLSESLVDKIKSFRTERIARIIDDNTPLPIIKGGGKIILHLIPLTAFNPGANIDIKPIIDSPHKLSPIYCSGHLHRINLEGLLKYASGSKDSTHSYVQLFRNGIIEAVEGLLLNPEGKPPGYEKHIPSAAYEEELLNSLSDFLNILNELNVAPPLLIFLCLAGVQDFRMSTSIHEYVTSYPMDRDVVILPESLVESYDTDPKDILRPIFDLIWNACGMEKSLNFDENGHWKKRR